jgi:hypothetical protein
MDHPTRHPTAPVELAGIAGDPELSLAAKGVLLVAITRPPGRPLIRAELLAHGREVRWQVDAALAELVETRWLQPAGDGRYLLREDPDDPEPGGAR